MPAPRPLTLLRPLLLVVALLALAAAGAQLARADDAAPSPPASVTIAPSDGGAARTLALADLAAQQDVHGATYTLRAADGTTSSVTVADGISLTALLTAAGLDADAFSYLEIARPDGSSALVLRDDLGGGEEGPPVVWVDADGVHVLRPSSGEGDANADDLVTSADGTLSMELRTGDPVKPRIAVSTLRARPHERVDFSASLAGGAALGPGLEYQWYFDGTGTALGANVSHRFPRPDTYLVLLNVVRGSGESIGLPDQVRVRVVRPRPDAQRGDARRSDEAQGGGGGGAGGSGAGGTGGGAGTGDGSGASGTDTSGAGIPSFTPVAPPAAPVPPSAATPMPTPRPHPEPVRHAPRGQLVSGTLIAASSAAAAPASGVRAAQAAGGAAADGPLHVPVGAWVALGLALLLAVGWALESRHTLPFWQP